MAGKILCITGPTAAGKSKLAMHLCKIKKQNKFQIISMDSAQIYKGVDISSAKPSKTDLLEVRHHLVDICDPTESYSAARFLKDTKKIIREITANGGTPLIVGGTMMYLQRLIHGIARVPDIPESEKALVESEGRRIGWGCMHEKLVKIDPEAARRINKNDSQRIVRQLSVWYSTGKTLSYWQKLPNYEGLNDKVRIVALVPDSKEELKANINTRLNSMIDEGMLEEVIKLKKDAGLTQTSPCGRLVGIRQAIDYIEGRTTFHKFVIEAELATRRLAKHQLTWLSKLENLTKIKAFAKPLSQLISIWDSDPDLDLTTPR
ncbi:tRNA (adenosine(37)-N6)-dimethylallyltransferase MiaA [Betaproteobacteria bacterium]|nr:tRNA (adenosine(37)-N6)-dimethylallyltransferase MiaA [Betaproteobacteria bacterium]